MTEAKRSIVKTKYQSIIQFVLQCPKFWQGQAAVTANQQHESPSDIVWHWDTLSHTEIPSGGTITYRLSADEGATWLYWDGSSWVESSNSAEANTVAVITDNFDEFPVTNFLIHESNDEAYRKKVLISSLYFVIAASIPLFCLFISPCSFPALFRTDSRELFISSTMDIVSEEFNEASRLKSIFRF